MCSPLDSGQAGMTYVRWNIEAQSTDDSATVSHFRTREAYCFQRGGRKMHQKVFRFYVIVLMVLGFLIPPFLCASGYFNDFEGAEPLDGFVVDGWGIRDVSDCEWGPQTAPSGTMAAGVPETCQSGYPNGNLGAVWVGTLTSPTFQLEDPTFTFTFSYWADFEGVTDTFDGLIIELINLTRADTVQVDSAAGGHLDPTYYDIIGVTTQSLVE